MIFFLTLYEKFISILRNIYDYIRTPKIIYNNHKNRVLICYITLPFNKQYNKNKFSHPSQLEVFLLANIFYKFGYSVDLVSYRSKFPINSDKYKIIIGFGDVYNKCIANNKFKGYKIAYMPGANPNYSNEAESIRLQYFYKRHGIRLKSRRRVNWDWNSAVLNSDLTLVLGNSWTLSTYAEFNNCILLPVPAVLPEYKPKISKNYNKGMKNFLWFGGSGAIHKGLDLVLDALQLLDSEYSLDICGSIIKEYDFMEKYKNILVSNRIRFHSFIDINSEQFTKIVDRCNFVIMPSCSEGGGSSVLTCMACGLVPIVTLESSIDVHDFGFLAKSPAVLDIFEIMNQASNTNVSIIKRMAENAKIYALENNSSDSYSQKLEEQLMVIK